MSTTTFRSFYWNSKRIQAAQSNSISIDTNATQMVGDGRIVAIANGVTMFQVQGDFVLTDDDTDIASMTTDALSKKPGTVSALLGTKLISCGVVITKVDIKSTSKSGETTAALTLINTEEPKLVG
jgi:hypothetical protein